VMPMCDMMQVSGYCGLLLGSPVILYEIIAFVVPGLTRSERKLLGPVVLGSSFLFYAGLAFSYAILTPAALNFFVNYAEGVVESLWSIDQYFEFVLVLMFSTGLSFQVRLRFSPGTEYCFLLFFNCLQRPYSYSTSE
jgi:sec-independent protein translocase protein TatC